MMQNGDPDHCDGEEPQDIALLWEESKPECDCAPKGCCEIELTLVADDPNEIQYHDDFTDCRCEEKRAELLNLDAYERATKTFTAGEECEPTGCCRIIKTDDEGTETEVWATSHLTEAECCESDEYKIGVCPMQVGHTDFTYGAQEDCGVIGWTEVRGYLRDRPRGVL